MHAIKGGWVGQTFALAKHNESEGRKSRVRLSKEERKTMVESFIKKYQSSNNGNFPSLNLTHKEVGGSFYTVREIVREVIQENRVLGPAKLSPNELSTNQFDEQYQLGSISKEPQTPLNITSNGSNFMPNHHKGTSTEPIAISDELFSEHENQRLDNEGIINGSHVDVRNEESAKTTCEELQTSKPSEAEERVKKSEASRAMVTLIAAEVVVETFPLRPVPKAAESSNARSGVDNVTETSEENEMEKADLDSGNGSASLDQINSSEMSGLLDEKNGKSREGLVVDIKSDLVDMEVVENFTDPQVSHANFSTTEGGTVHDTLAGENVGVEVPNNDVVTSERYEKSQSIDGTKEINTTNGKIPNNTYGSNTRVESESPKAVLIADEADVQRKESFRRRNNPKSDSINLDTWDGASRNSAEKEINPLLAIVKSFVTAFIKFWSE